MFFSCKTSLSQISEACTNPRMQVLCVFHFLRISYIPKVGSASTVGSHQQFYNEKNHIIVDLSAFASVAKSTEILIFGWAMVDQNDEEYIKTIKNVQLDSDLDNMFCKLSRVGISRL